MLPQHTVTPDHRLVESWEEYTLIQDGVVTLTLGELNSLPIWKVQHYMGLALGSKERRDNELEKGGGSTPDKWEQFQQFQEDVDHVQHKTYTPEEAEEIMKKNMENDDDA